MVNASIVDSQSVEVEAGAVSLPGDLSVPDGATGLVVFAHGSGSSRFSPRNREVAQTLNRAGLATLLFDLLTAQENEIDERTRELRFDIGMLGRRLVQAVDWLGRQDRIRELPIGLFGASTGAAAALIAAAERPQVVRSVVSRGGRPDLAKDFLERVEAPTLLIVGGLDTAVIELNQGVSRHLASSHRLEIIPGATHLFEEPGKLDEVAALARDWFLRHLAPAVGHSVREN